MSGKPYTRRRVRTVWGGVHGNQPEQPGNGAGYLPYYLSEALDKETIKIRTGGKSGSSFSENEQVSGRDLMTKGEVRGLPDDKCIVMVRGEYGVIDDKYNITKHPNFKKIAMGGAPTFTQNFNRINDAEKAELERMQQEMLMFEYPLESDGEVYQGGLTRSQANQLSANLQSSHNQNQGERRSE